MTIAAILLNRTESSSRKWGAEKISALFAGHRIGTVFKTTSHSFVSFIRIYSIHTAFRIYLIRVFKSLVGVVLITCLHQYILYVCMYVCMYVCRSGRLYLKIIASLTESINRNVILLYKGIFKKNCLNKYDFLLYRSVLNTILHVCLQASLHNSRNIIHAYNFALNKFRWEKLYKFLWKCEIFLTS